MELTVEKLMAMTRAEQLAVIDNLVNDHVAQVKTCEQNVVMAEQLLINSREAHSRAMTHLRLAVESLDKSRGLRREFLAEPEVQN